MLKEILIPLCIGLISCRSTNDSVGVGSGNATVKIALNGSNFDDTGTLDNQASITKKAITATGEQRQEISLEGNNDYKLVATLTPINSTNSITPQATSKTNPITETETSPLGIGIKYKVVVYNVIGNYVKEQDFTSGQNTPDITGLDGGSTYTFVVYSIGSSTDLPSVTYSNPSNKTLSTASLNNVSGDSDLMYYSSSLRLSGNNINNLDIILKHKFSQFIVSIDTSQTSYIITNINGTSISQHNSNADMQLSNGQITYTGINSEKPVSFTSLNSKLVFSDPVMINSLSSTNGIFKIQNITMTHQNDSPVSHKNIIFKELTILPGVKYNLRLSFKANDQYLNYRGYPAVRINGIIWMRHNLGADTSVNPDIPTQLTNGNYYQWGHKNAVASEATSANAIPGWDKSYAPNNAWNSGSFFIAEKTINDPCPSGWRVPTNREINILDTSTTKTTIGVVKESSNNYSAAKVLTSIYNTEVKMTIPFSGYRSSSDGTLLSRGTGGIIWSATANSSNLIQAVQWAIYDHYPSNDNFPWTEKNEAAPVRCLAEFPID
ncbi:hypothetical protein HZP94_08290 [Elizabethkingia anophelis]|nr:hypothetical protein [Elizabethkingia anophelis]MCT4062931.1 hypothetical protein [Elizabethkingia anophelis]MCT4109222.1 hypothetical protein [Elizabethkingia anophelis]